MYPTSVPLRMEACAEGVGGEPGAFCDTALLKQGPWLTGAGGRHLGVSLEHVGNTWDLWISFGKTPSKSVAADMSADCCWRA